MITQDKNHIPPPRMPHWFSRQSYRSLTGNRQRHSERITCRKPLQWFLNVWDNVPMNLKYVCQQYFTCMCLNSVFSFLLNIYYLSLHQYYMLNSVFSSFKHIIFSITSILYIYCMLVREIFIFPEPACYKCFIILNETKKTHTCKILLANIF
jgi:hypothetical protein